MADRDPAIKIFGRTFPMPDAGPAEAQDPDPIAGTGTVDEDEEKYRRITNTEAKDPKADVTEEKNQGELAVSSVLNNSHEDDYQTSTQDDKEAADSKSKLERDQSEVDTSGQEEVLKKPDKILPCPRCNSMDTKFCYYNNYNVNQPRHFCKNCQRYWTAGGMMRNVPVGAGRRKCKQPGHYQALPAGISAPTRPLDGNGALLKFSSEAPICESIPPGLNFEEQKRDAKIGSMAGGENGDEPSCASSEGSQNVFHGCYNGLAAPVHPVQYFPGPPWPYWGPGWSDVAAMSASHYSENGTINPHPWTPPAMLAAPPFCAPPAPFPFVPASYWGCMPSWPNGAWNVPWLGPNSNRIHSGNDSPTLGKHLRSDSSREEEKSEKSLWVPKTLRIHDPDEAAKSSIWSTLGIKPDESVKRSGLFKAFRPGNESCDQASAPAHILHANPAALSRSRAFQEST